MPLVITSVPVNGAGAPVLGTVTITGNGSGLTYAPNTGFFGTDSFTYTVSDGNGGTAIATVNVTVNGVGNSGGSGGTIGDFVWNDVDQDGVQDGNEFGIAGITVYLFDGANNLIATTVTDWSGHYAFSGLAAGYYQVAFVKPTGYVFSPKDQGSDDTIDSDADIYTGRSAVFYLAPDQQYLDLDAGMYFDGSGA